MNTNEETVLLSLFSTNLLIKKLGFAYSQEELSEIEKLSQSCSKNTGNYVTNDYYVLDEPVLHRLKARITECLDEYMQNVLVADNQKIRITQSWINFTEKGGHHHLHRHPNSYLSGVLYIDVFDDSITFYDDRFQSLEVRVKEHTTLNSSIMNIPVSVGDILLFPSYAYHRVDGHENDRPRVSLSFNTMLTGDIGYPEHLTGLTL